MLAQRGILEYDITGVRPGAGTTSRPRPPKGVPAAQCRKELFMAFKAKQTYKGHALVRHNKDIYLGDMAGPYVVFMQILTTRQEDGEELPEKINVMLLSTDETLAPKDRIAKQSVKVGLYNALDFAAILLERALADAKKA